MSADYQVELGSRLRAIRNQQGLTLSEVEERSGGTWKAVVVGSYERGDRAISIGKLARLADFYGVPMRDIVPDHTEPEAERERAPRVVLDLTRLPEPSDEQGLIPALSRFARRIQLERGDYNGSVLTIRQEDVRALALAFGASPHEVIDRLEAERVVTG